MLETTPKIDSAYDCWVLGFLRCERDMQACTVHLSVAQWARIARGSRISHAFAEQCAESGTADVQVFSENWEQDLSQIVRFFIHWEWHPESLVIISISE